MLQQLWNEIYSFVVRNENREVYTTVIKGSCNVYCEALQLEGCPMLHWSFWALITRPIMHHQPTNSKIPQPQRTHTAPGIMQSDNCRAELFMIQRIFLACFFMGDVPPNAEFRQLGGPNYIVSHKKHPTLFLNITLPFLSNFFAIFVPVETGMNVLQFTYRYLVV